MADIAAARPRKEKLLALDFVRAFAILAVVTIHVTADATVQLQSGSTAWQGYVALNKLSNFAVPVFLFLSGLVLFYRYDGDWGAKQAAVFYGRRLRQILIPYLLWSFFYYVYNQGFNGLAAIRVDLSDFASKLLWAETSYHLYYIVIIVQFYILFPLLMTLVNRSRIMRLALAPLGIAVQAGAYWYGQWVGPIPHKPSLCITYFALFCIGGAIGLHYKAFASWLKRHVWWIIVLALALGGSYAAMFISQLSGQMSFKGIYYELVFNLYPVFAVMAMIWIGQWLAGRRGWFTRILRSIGAASFGIYLMHPAVLTFWKIVLERQTGDMLRFHVNILLAFAATLLIPWAAAYVYGLLIKPLRGRGPKKLEAGA